MKLTESLENYLEVIFHIQASKGAARAKDIALGLNVNNSSVTEALRSLAKKGLVNYAPYDLITLTSDGTEIAKVIVNRHKVIRQFLLEALDMPEDDADSIACRIEHVVNDTLILKLQKLSDYLAEKAPDWDK
ncbi:MAG: metal-dependent transcriptional regulator [Lentisphaeria bacterium]|nr:metal-dependent transcriptional regulator [Lentisphaeria bacterium]MCK5872997.1 metal-dependent transcriptional regulator [Methylococcales bacterium]